RSALTPRRSRLRTVCRHRQTRVRPRGSVRSRGSGRSWWPTRSSPAPGARRQASRSSSGSARSALRPRRSWRHLTAVLGERNLVELGVLAAIGRAPAGGAMALLEPIEHGPLPGGLAEVGAARLQLDLVAVEVQSG